MLPWHYCPLSVINLLNDVICPFGGHFFGAVCPFSGHFFGATIVNDAICPFGGHFSTILVYRVDSFGVWT
jgi:hypothetical protein